MIEDFLIPFLSIGLAELGDKTQLAVISLSSKTKETKKLFLGVISAFLITSLIAIFFGTKLEQIIPEFYLGFISGILFILFGVLIFMHEREVYKKPKLLKNIFLTSFLLILLSEMGDKSQFVTGIFATRYNPFFVFLGVLISLCIISFIAIFCGKLISKKLSMKKINYMSSILFFIIGFSFLFKILF